MHYRLFEPDDFSDLYAIEEVCFEPPERFSRRYMRELTSSCDAATWIAEEQLKISGFAIVEWTSQISGVVAYIATIEVLPDYRGRGIGRELMGCLEGSANAGQALAISLHVDLENAPAICLYEHLGYRNTGRIDHYYARNRPAAIYVKHLV